MANLEYEKPSKGNPYQLTIKQHVFPKRMIDRFTNEATKKVDVIRKKNLHRLSLGPKSEIFCAMRQWDQKSESIIGKSIEDRFSQLVTNIIENPFYSITDNDNKTINSFYALITARQNCKYKPHMDFKTPSGIEKSHNIDKVTQEKIESKNAFFLRETGFPSRFFNGFSIQRNIDYFTIHFGKLRWDICHLSHGEIVVPEMIDFFFIPISPNIFLTPAPSAKILNLTDCIALNQCINTLCQRSSYFFARDLTKCSGFNLSDPWAFHPYHLVISKPLQL
ncbi:hypothetical protein ACQ5TV_05565 [Acetobacter ghanensis]|uniref:hypothetical protein n=1 Tax=Acetobacter ghanensis TaxID=431306 RepID=UPI003D33BFFF